VNTQTLTFERHISDPLKSCFGPPEVREPLLGTAALGIHRFYSVNGIQSLVNCVWEFQKV